MYQNGKPIIYWSAWSSKYHQFYDKIPTLSSWNENNRFPRFTTYLVLAQLADLSVPLLYKCTSRLLSISLPNINRLPKFLHCILCRKFAIKRSFIIARTYRYTTLRNIRFKNFHRRKARQRQTKRTRTEESVKGVCTNRGRPATKSWFDMPNITDYCRTDHFSSRS